ncbi:MAG: hypothetical protein Q8J71_00095 [Brevundimonas sp.]|nr:hypothetical protein [Brevundimonas sp.]
MKTATIRKALLPVLAASAVMVATPALAQNFGVTVSFGSPGYNQGYSQGYDRRYAPPRGYSPRELQYRARVLSQQIDRMARDRRVNHGQVRSLQAQMTQYHRLERQYARNGLTARQYAELNNRLNRIQMQVQRVQYSRW